MLELVQVVKTAGALLVSWGAFLLLATLAAIFPGEKPTKEQTRFVGRHLLMSFAVACIAGIMVCYASLADSPKLQAGGITLFLASALPMMVYVRTIRCNLVQQFSVKQLMAAAFIGLYVSALVLPRLIFGQRLEGAARWSESLAEPLVFVGALLVMLLAASVIEKPLLRDYERRLRAECQSSRSDGDGVC